MNRALLPGMLALVTIVFPAIGASVETGDLTGVNGTADPIEYLVASLQAFPIVCLAEGGHQAREPHKFLRRLLCDESVLKAVDVIIVEFAATRHQAVLDAYIRGEEVPFTKLRKVWRDTRQSPQAPWDSPLYYELLKTIRQGNLTLSGEDQVRVVAGDPPIDWGNIKNREDFSRSQIPRDLFVASLAMEQAFDLEKKVLIIFGGAHLPKVPVGPEGDSRNSLAYLVLREHPGTVRVISFLDPENLQIEDRMDELVEDRIYVTAGHWVGEVNAELVFPEVFSLVTDATTGQQSWKNVTLYSGYVIRDLFDALVYVGPSSEWNYVPYSFDPKLDEGYLKELNRRSMVLYGRPFVLDK